MYIDRLGIHIGSILYIRFYALIIITGAICGALLAAYLAKKRKMNPDIIWDMLPWILLTGIIGARIWHILTPSPSLVAQGVTTGYYLTHPLKAIAIWEGGLGIVGGVFAGFLTLLFYLRRRNMPILPWLDVLAPGLILAQAIGRWGNFVNQELYGAPSTLPWAIFIEPSYRLPEYIDVAYYHPTFLYESLWNLGILAILLFLSKRGSNWIKQGDVFLFYLSGYSLGRFLIEFLRLDSSLVAGVNANQMFMVGVFLVSLGAIVFKHLRKDQKLSSG